MTEILSKPQYYKVTCPYCLANLRFDLGSVSYVKSMNETEWLYGELYCPNCSNRVKVADGKKLSTNIVTPCKYRKPSDGQGD